MTLICAWLLGVAQQDASVGECVEGSVVAVTGT